MKKTLEHTKHLVILEKVSNPKLSTRLNFIIKTGKTQIYNKNHYYHSFSTKNESSSNPYMEPNLQFSKAQNPNPNPNFTFLYYEFPIQAKI